MIEGIDLSSLDPSQLPIVPSSGTDTGAYDQPDCTNGIAAGDGACTTAGATARSYLTASPATALDPDLKALLDASLPGATPVASADGSGALASAAAVVNALVASGDASVAALGQKLGTYAVADQVTLVNALLTATVSPATLGDVTGLAGLFTAYPMLELTAPEVAAGTYSGTLTITLID